MVFTAEVTVVPLTEEGKLPPLTIRATCVSSKENPPCSAFLNWNFPGLPTQM